jgi:hypothetical protein
MTAVAIDKAAKSKRERVTRRTRTGLGAIGIEAEFAIVVDGQTAKPEEVFGSPTHIIRGPMMHRTGRSYHLPTGGAIYFDTGVIELATPVIEIEPGCAARAGRSLWESIHFLRGELDAWEDLEGRSISLAGFSTHYNVSFDVPYKQRGAGQRVEQLALLLTHVLPIPVMLLAANRRSTGVGVRPRVNRIEVTADFTPDAALMIAAATLIVGVSREIMSWPAFGIDALDAHDLPVPRDFTPEPHSSRHGWVARCSSFIENPFLADVNAPIWPTRAGETLSLRTIADRITRRFWPAIAKTGDPRSLRLISAVMSGRRASMLELDDRPLAYESVGRSCRWTNLFPLKTLSRSKYERIFMRAIAGQKLRLHGDSYTPTGMRGWSHVVFLRDRDQSRRVLSLDFLLRHERSWM